MQICGSNFLQLYGACCGIARAYPAGVDVRTRGCASLSSGNMRNESIPLQKCDRQAGDVAESKCQQKK